MKRIKNTNLILSVILMIGLSAGAAYGQAGQAAVPFLLISPDARASGMGEVGTAIADDINAVYWNPAGLGFHGYIKEEGEEDSRIPYRQVSLTYSKWLPQFNADLYYGYLSAGHYFEVLDGTVAFNFIFMNLGEFTRTDINGMEHGKFISNEFAVGLSYGTMIAKDLGFGFQLHYIQSDLAPASQDLQSEAGIGRSGSIDLGVLWKPSDLDIFGLDLSDRISLGMNLQNVGPKITYRKESDPLPTQLRLATAVTVLRDDFSDWKFAFDFAKLLVRRDEFSSDPVPKSFVTGWKNPGAELALGTEYWYEQTVALRAGFFSEPSKSGNRRYWNFGLGVRYDIFHLDFSFINTIEENHPLANTMRFSLLVDFK